MCMTIVDVCVHGLIRVWTRSIHQ